MCLATIAVVQTQHVGVPLANAGGIGGVAGDEATRHPGNALGIREASHTISGRQDLPIFEVAPGVDRGILTFVQTGMSV